jgi:hypothetical protein
MNNKVIFAEGYKTTPYRWDACDDVATEVLAATAIATIAESYESLSCALELAPESRR